MVSVIEKKERVSLNQVVIKFYDGDGCEFTFRLTCKPLQISAFFYYVDDDLTIRKISVVCLVAKERKHILLSNIEPMHDLT